MLIVSYPMRDDWPRIERLIDEFMHLHGFERDGSGAGFGFRDLEYSGSGEAEFNEGEGRDELFDIFEKSGISLYHQAEGEDAPG